MRFKRRSDSPFRKKARRGFRGYPVATIAFYGPDDQRATKVAVAIVNEAGAEPVALSRWFTEDHDARSDLAIASAILEFIQQHGTKSVIAPDRIIGCPHEEGVDYPEGAVCPRCPFWAHRDRWTGDLIQQGANLLQQSVRQSFRQARSHYSCYMPCQSPNVGD